MPVCIVLQEKHYKRRTSVHQSKRLDILLLCWGILHGTLFLCRRSRLTYLLFSSCPVSSCLFSRSYETRGLSGQRLYSFPLQGHDGWLLSYMRALLTRGQPYFYVALRICMRTVKDVVFCELSRALEEYSIRCNGITVIWFQNNDICNLLQLL